MKTYVELISETVTRENDIYRLFVEVKQDKIPELVQLRFFSTFSAASRPKQEQTKWRTTVDKSVLKTLVSALSNYEEKI